MKPVGGLTHSQIAGCFNRGLGRRYQARLIGGSDEPLYLPGSADRPAAIYYTRDYAASALHELAHWCIAGAARRIRPDYGYWYRPPPRSLVEQAAFCVVEVPVQALEARFAAACGLPFRVSVDDLSGSEELAASFSLAVSDCLRSQDERCLPPRASALLEDFEKLRARLHSAGGQRQRA